MDMYTELMEIMMPIFKDRMVIILMALVRLFESENDESIKRIRNRFQNWDIFSFFVLKDETFGLNIVLAYYH